MNSIKRLRKKMLKKSIMLVLISIVLLFNCFIVKADTKNRIYYISDDIEIDLDCWVGWKEIHYGIVGVATKRGDTVRIKASDTIEGGVVHTDNYNDIITKGYGYYSIDFRNHMIGLLNAISRKISNRKVEDIIDEEGNKIGEKWLHEYLTDAMTNIVANNYSYKYEMGDFVNFWTKCIQSGIISESELKKVQNDFYYKAYCESAFDVLTNMMRGTYTGLTTEQKQILKGVVFSVMEARYRNKNVNGKMNLAIKASEGEVWPFLVKLKNLNNIIYDKDANKYKDEKAGLYNYYEWPTFDEMIDGVYQWMYYVEADISGNNMSNIKKDTIMTAVNSSMEEEGEDIDIDWEGEYYKLTRQDIPKMDTKELSKFYSDVSKVKSLFKKNSENTEGIFGVEESYTIESTINYSDALVNMKKGIEKFCTEVGGDVETIFNGLNDNNMERTYLMAKNIVASNKGIEEYAYYDIGTNIITHTPGTDGNYYLLVDFQKVELDTPIRYYDGEHMVWSGDDKDIDGILDRDELGSRERGDKERINILPFVKKMVEKELYGEDDESIRSAEGQLIINSALATMKYNVYKEREDFYNAHINDNIQDRKEIASNYLNVDDATSNRIGIIESDTTKTNAQKEAEIRSILGDSNAKLEVTLWNYESNPDLMDTDFDGIDDGYGYDENDNPIKAHNSVIYDKNPKNNHFKGKMNSTRLSGNDGIEVEMNMDYRYFLMSNRLYYDELSTMSLLMANSIYMRNSGIEVQDINNEKVGTDYKNLRIKDLMSFYGFKDVEVYYMGSNNDQGYEDGYICKNYSDTHKGAIAIGHKKVKYHGLEKEVVGIVCRGTAEDDDWDTDFDIGDLEFKDAIKDKVSSGKDNYTLNFDKIDSYINAGSDGRYDKKYKNELAHFVYGYPDWSHKYHHAGFDIVANRELEIIKNYIDDEKGHGKDMDANMCYWITGHSMGAAVANLIAAHLINEEQDNVYCYTFAAPNNFYLTDNVGSSTLGDETTYYEIEAPKASKYRCIFNIVNSDDFVPKVPMNECGWTKYGQVAEQSLSHFSISSPYYIRYKIHDSLGYHPEYLKVKTTKLEDFLFDKYNGNEFSINKLIETFNEVYKKFNENNMRLSTYTYRYNGDGIEEEKDYKDDSKGIEIKCIINDENDILTDLKNARPYQKMLKNEKNILQLQMPAYFLQNIAHAMHKYKDDKNNDGEYVDAYSSNEMKMFFTNFANRYINAKSKLISNSLLKNIEDAHYLESYYILTKSINASDFR